MITPTPEDHEQQQVADYRDLYESLLDNYKATQGKLERSHRAVLETNRLIREICGAVDPRDGCLPYDLPAKITEMRARLAHAHDAANKLYQAAKIIVDTSHQDIGEEGEEDPVYFVEPEAFDAMQAALSPAEAEACARESTRRDRLEAEIKALRRAVNQGIEITHDQAIKIEEQKAEIQRLTNALIDANNERATYERAARRCAADMLESDKLLQEARARTVRPAPTSLPPGIGTLLSAAEQAEEIQRLNREANETVNLLEDERRTFEQRIDQLRATIADLEAKLARYEGPGRAYAE